MIKTTSSRHKQRSYRVPGGGLSHEDANETGDDDSRLGAQPSSSSSHASAAGPADAKTESKKEPASAVDAQVQAKNTSPATEAHPLLPDNHELWTRAWFGSASKSGAAPVAAERVPVAIRNVPAAGNGLFATRAIAPGECIFTEPPIAVAYDADQLDLYCHRCGLMARNQSSALGVVSQSDEPYLSEFECAAVTPCERCKYAHYCSTDCQRTDATRHQPMCDALCRIAPRVPQRSVMLVCTMLWQHQREQQQQQQQQTSSAAAAPQLLAHSAPVSVNEALLRLQTHRDKLSVKEAEEIASGTFLVRHILSSASNQVVIDNLGAGKSSGASKSAISKPQEQYDDDDDDDDEWVDALRAQHDATHAEAAASFHLSSRLDDAPFLESSSGSTNSASAPTDSSDNAFAPEMAFNLACLARSNGFAMDGGVFVAGRASLLNHSCLSNCTVSLRANRVVVRAHSRIAEGQELLVSYRDLLQARVQWQAQVERGYHFACSCLRCTAPLDLTHPFGQFDASLVALEFRGKTPPSPEQLAAEVKRNPALLPSGKPRLLLDPAMHAPEVLDFQQRLASITSSMIEKGDHLAAVSALTQLLLECDPKATSSSKSPPAKTGLALSRTHHLMISAKRKLAMSAMRSQLPQRFDLAVQQFRHIFAPTSLVALLPAPAVVDPMEEYVHALFGALEWRAEHFQLSGAQIGNFDPSVAASRTSNPSCSNLDELYVIAREAYHFARRLGTLSAHTLGKQSSRLASAHLVERNAEIVLSHLLQSGFVPSAKSQDATLRY
ncbi:hypothetical protein CAOG_00050 [Capsaspora owczarzaki ATCC 30864]|uniref:hypothetical protein n=1 Tax=Capsaspora owczarzaki (strain ATCC 30864) TaxID=595528 RepID=UPI0003526C5C|nr:hypothetical protein CAOG_00050 [Capsaspora owczarzaki ATCC 30864]|eukprot:XP_004364921.2 hypothetical protein CAOG_00050 [Capsaspora owczarzaki ATCC 30864]